MKKGGFEFVHEFSSLFMREYNSIPANIKPLAGAAKLHYDDAFESDFALLLRERKSSSLHGMFKYALEVESNMMACGKMKHKLESDKGKIREEIVPSTYVVSSSSDIRFEMILKAMEKMMDKLTVDNRPLNREQNEPQIRNPNFRRPNPPQPPQIKPRDIRNPRNPNGQQIQPPFPENYVDGEGEEEPNEDQIHHFGDLVSDIYLIETKHDMYAQEDANKYFQLES